jgi:hypothetical protein
MSASANESHRAMWQSIRKEGIAITTQSTWNGSHFEETL